MEFVIALLTAEKAKMELKLRQEKILQANMPQARLMMNQVKQLKMGIKVLKARQGSKNHAVITD
jgi:hypothetical protein